MSRAMRIPRHGLRWKVVRFIEQRVWRWADEQPKRRNGRVVRGWLWFWQHAVEPIGGGR